MAESSVVPFGIPVSSTAKPLSYTAPDAIAALFGAQWTGGRNQGVITVIDTELTAAIVNPVNLYNPGYGIFSMDLTGTSVAGVFENGNRAIARSGGSIVNGFLNDTFLDGVQGVQLYKNEINSLIGNTPTVPEPSTLLFLSVGVAGMGLLRKRIRK